MKTVSLVAQIIFSSFLALLSIPLFAQQQVMSGTFMLLAALIASPFSSKIFKGIGIHTFTKKILLKSVFVFAFIIGAFVLDKSPKSYVNKKTIKTNERTEINVSKPTKANVAEIIAISIDTLKLKSFQKKWTDSVVKDWAGSYIKSGTLSKSLDTIYFQLSKNASKGNWQFWAEGSSLSLQQDYDSLVSLRFGNEFSSLETKIILLPDIHQLKENTVIAEREKLVNKQFSAWNGSNRYLSDYIKQNMNDPGSYEHVSTHYSDKGGYIFVRTAFRGKNAFGAKVLNVITAKIDIDGNILSVSEE